MILEYITCKKKSSSNELQSDVEAGITTPQQTEQYRGITRAAETDSVAINMELQDDNVKIIPGQDAMFPVLQRVVLGIGWHIANAILGEKFISACQELTALPWKLKEIRDSQDGVSWKISRLNDMLNTYQLYFPENVKDYTKMLSEWLMTLNQLVSVVTAQQSEMVLLTRLQTCLEQAENLLNNECISRLLDGQHNILIQRTQQLRMAFRQVENVNKIPEGASLDDYITALYKASKEVGPDALQPWLTLAKTVSEKIKEMPTIQSALPQYPADGSLWSQVSWLLDVLMKPEVRKQLPKWCDASQLAVIEDTLIWIQSIREFPTGQSAGTQALWLQSVLSSVPGRVTHTPLPQFFLGMPNDVTVCRLYDLMLKISQPGVSHWDIATEIYNLIDRRTLLTKLGIEAIRGTGPVGAVTSMSTEAIQAIYKQYDSQMTWSEMSKAFWTNISEQLMRDPMGNLNTAAAYIPGGHYVKAVAGTIWSYKQLPVNSTWENTVHALLRYPIQTSPEIAWVYNRYLEFCLLWKVYHTFRCTEQTDTQTHLQKMATLLKSYTTSYGLTALDRLIDMLPLLPALSEASKELPSIQGSASLLEWASQLIDVLYNSDNSLMVQLRDRLAHLVGKWLSDAILASLPTWEADKSNEQDKDTVAIDMALSDRKVNEENRDTQPEIAEKQVIRPKRSLGNNETEVSSKDTLDGNAPFGMSESEIDSILKKNALPSGWGFAGTMAVGGGLAIGSIAFAMWVYRQQKVTPSGERGEGSQEEIELVEMLLSTKEEPSTGQSTNNSRLLSAQKTEQETTVQAPATAVSDGILSRYKYPLAMGIASTLLLGGGVAYRYFGNNTSEENAEFDLTPADIGMVVDEASDWAYGCWQELTEQSEEHQLPSLVENSPSVGINQLVEYLFKHSTQQAESTKEMKKFLTRAVAKIYRDAATTKNWSMTVANILIAIDILLKQWFPAAGDDYEKTSAFHNSMLKLRAIVYDEIGKLKNNRDAKDYLESQVFMGGQIEKRHVYETEKIITGRGAAINFIDETIEQVLKESGFPSEYKNKKIYVKIKVFIPLSLDFNVWKDYLSYHKENVLEVSLRDFISRRYLRARHGFFWWRANDRTRSAYDYKEFGVPHDSKVIKFKEMMESNIIWDKFVENSLKIYEVVNSPAAITLLEKTIRWTVYNSGDCTLYEMLDPDFFERVSFVEYHVKGHGVAERRYQLGNVFAYKNKIYSLENGKSAHLGVRILKGFIGSNDNNVDHLRHRGGAMGVGIRLNETERVELNHLHISHLRRNDLGNSYAIGGRDFVDIITSGLSRNDAESETKNLNKKSVHLYMRYMNNEKCIFNSAGKGRVVLIKEPKEVGLRKMLNKNLSNFKSDVDYLNRNDREVFWDSVSDIFQAAVLLLGIAISPYLGVISSIIIMAPLGAIPHLINIANADSDADVINGIQGVLFSIAMDAVTPVLFPYVAKFIVKTSSVVKNAIKELGGVMHTSLISRCITEELEKLYKTLKNISASDLSLKDKDELIAKAFKNTESPIDDYVESVVGFKSRSINYKCRRVARALDANNCFIPAAVTRKRDVDLPSGSRNALTPLNNGNLFSNTFSKEALEENLLEAFSGHLSIKKINIDIVISDSNTIDKVVAENVKGATLTTSDVIVPTNAIAVTEMVGGEGGANLGRIHIWRDSPEFNLSGGGINENKLRFTIIHESIHSIAYKNKGGFGQEKMKAIIGRNEIDGWYDLDEAFTDFYARQVANKLGITDADIQSNYFIKTPVADSHYFNGDDVWLGHLPEFMMDFVIEKKGVAVWEQFTKAFFNGDDVFFKKFFTDNSQFLKEWKNYNTVLINETDPAVLEKIGNVGTYKNWKGVERPLTIKRRGYLRVEGEKGNNSKRSVANVEPLEENNSDNHFTLENKASAYFGDLIVNYDKVHTLKELDKIIIIGTAKLWQWMKIDYTHLAGIEPENLKVEWQWLESDTSDADSPWSSFKYQPKFRNVNTFFCEYQPQEEDIGNLVRAVLMHKTSGKVIRCSEPIIIVKTSIKSDVLINRSKPMLASDVADVLVNSDMATIFSRDGYWTPSITFPLPNRFSGKKIFIDHRASWSTTVKVNNTTELIEGSTIRTGNKLTYTSDGKKWVRG